MNNDLISREALISKYLQTKFDTENDMNKVEILIDNAPPIETTIENLISTLSVEELKATTWFKVDIPSGEAISFRREKTGEWITESKLYGGYGDSVLVNTCSICKTSFIYRGKTQNFCSNCGADMRKEEV